MDRNACLWAKGPQDPDSLYRCEGVPRPYASNGLPLRVAKGHLGLQLQLADALVVAHHACTGYDSKPWPSSLDRKLPSGIKVLTQLAPFMWLPR